VIVVWILSLLIDLFKLMCQMPGR